mmetsp:Transcript_19193/g.27993  ORF Transcript_19193/g.27993 Transcript_19193/m.27993 type:complete len:243 (+) Transcript_19193:296-1024(+)
MNIIPVKAGEEIELKQSKIRNGVRFYLRPFHVSHGGHPTLGYTVISKTTTNVIKEEYSTMEGKKLGELARSGVAIKDMKTIEKVEIMYSGDTSVDGLMYRTDREHDTERNDLDLTSMEYLRQGFHAPLFLCEMTFLDPKDADLAKARGHLNVANFEPILSSHGWTAPENCSDERQILLYHVSAKHGPAEHILDKLCKHLPPQVLSVTEVALASFISKDSKTFPLLKTNGCVSMKEYKKSNTK